MKRIKKADAMDQFNKDIYLLPPIYITSNLFWDGGIKTDSSLKEKFEFYYISERISSINCIKRSNPGIRKS